MTLANYNNFLSRTNGLLDLKGWVFVPGMEFGAERFWWNGRQRPYSHEGIDFQTFQDHEGQLHGIKADFLVAAALEGEIIQLTDDFLGRSIFIRHEFTDELNRFLLTIYGHLTPKAGLVSGKRVKAGEVLGKVADPGAKGSKVPPHFHLSLAWIPRDFLPSLITWPRLNKTTSVEFIDPLSFPT